MLHYLRYLAGRWDMYNSYIYPRVLHPHPSVPLQRLHHGKHPLHLPNIQYLSSQLTRLRLRPYHYRLLVVYLLQHHPGEHLYGLGMRLLGNLCENLEGGPIEQ